MVSGAWRSAAAQTAHFASALSALATTSTNDSQFNPIGVAVDSSGNVYISDEGNYQVVKVPAGCTTASCQIVLASTITNAGLGPYGVAVDSAGNVYISDANNGQVLKLSLGCTTANCQTVLANTTTNGPNFTPTGVAVDSGGNVYVADEGYEQVFKLGATCNISNYTNSNLSSCQTILASTSTNNGQFNPVGVAVDTGGNVYIADSNANQQVLMLSAGCTAASCQTVLANIATNSGGISPVAVAVDGSGNVYIADIISRNVLKLTAGCTTANCQTVLASSTTNGSGFSPWSMAISASGNIYIADQAINNQQVDELQLTAANVGTVNVGSTSSTATLYFIFDSAGTLNGTTPYQVLTQGATGLDFAAASSGNTCSGSFNTGDTCKVNVQFTPTHPGARYGAAILEDTNGNTIATADLQGTGAGPQVVFPSNTTAKTVGSGFVGSYGVAVDAAGDLFVTDPPGHAVYEIVAGTGGAASGTVTSSSTRNAVGSGFSGPLGVAVDGAGDLFVADPGQGAVKEIVAVNGVVSSSSTVISVGSGFNNPDGVAVDGSGNVFVADSGFSAVKEVVAVDGVVSSGSTVISVGSGFHQPYGVAVDGLGNVFVADTRNNSAKEIVAGTGGAASGQVNSSSTVNIVGSGFNQPTGVAVDAAGNVFVADTRNNSAKEIVAGTGGAASGQVNSSSTVNSLGSGFPVAQGIAVDGAGNVFVANFNVPSEVREIPLATPPSLNFAQTSVSSTSSDSPKSVPVANNGNATLTLSGLTVSNNWTIASGGSNCSSTSSVAEDSSCTLAISFSPLSAGNPHAGTVTLTDNSLNVSNATQNILLSGGATQLAFGFVPTIDVLVGGDAGSNITVQEEYPLGTVDTSATDTITLTVAGPSSYSATYTATASAGIATFNLSSVALTTLGSYTYTASLAGIPNAVANEIVVAPPVNLSSGESVGSSTAAQMVTVNIATAGTVSTIDVLTQGASNLDFTRAGSPNAGTCTTTSYSAGQSCSVGVIFTPQYPGIRNGVVLLTNASGVVLGMVHLQGTGTGPQVNFSFIEGSSPPFLYSPSTQGILGGGFNLPSGVAVDGSGNVYVADGSKVAEMPAGCASSSCVTTLGSSFPGPSGVAVDGSGNVYVADNGGNGLGAVYEILAVNGSIPASPTINTLGGGFVTVLGVAVDGNGNVYVADKDAHAVYEMLAVNGSVPASPTIFMLGSGFSNPSGIAVDGSGNVFVADIGNNTVKELLAVNGSIPSSPTIKTLGGGLFNSPDGVAVDGLGNVYVSDTGNHTVYELLAVNGSLPASPTINTLGQSFSSPDGLAVDSRGNVYVANGTAVDELDYADPPSLSFPTSTVAGTTDTADSAQSVQIENIGNAALTAVAPGLSVESDFLLVAGSGIHADCTANFSLSAGSSCNLSFKFAPTATANIGTVNGSAVLTDNNLNASPSTTQTIPLSGVALPAPPVISASFSPSSVPDTGTTNTTLTITITNPNSITLHGIAFSSSYPAGVVFSHTTGSNNCGGGGAYTNSVVSINSVTLAAGTSCSLHPIVSATIASTVTYSTGTVTSTETGARTGAAASATLTATPGTPTHFNISVPNPIPSYVSTAITITALDAAGNVVTGYTGPALLSSSDPGEIIGFTNPITMTNGVFSSTGFVLKTAGNQSVTVTDTSNPSITSSTTVLVLPGPAVFLVVSAPATATAGTAFNGTVTAKDLFGNVATGYTGTVHFTSTDSHATLPADTTLTNGTGIFSTTLRAPGNQSIAATDTVTLSVAGVSGSIALTAANFVVNSTNDDVAGVVANCPANPSGSGSGSCTLRDALAAATNFGGGNISFDSTVFATAQTIQLLSAGGSLNIPSNTSITGSTTGSGSTRTNLVTVRGGGSSSIFAVFSVSSGVTGASIANLTITNGHYFSGGGIINSGALTVTGSTISGNSSSDGGGIYNSGTLTVTASTVSGNSSGQDGGGMGNDSGGTLTVINSTISGNSASDHGGGIDSGIGTLTVANSTFSSNTADYGGAIDNYGNSMNVTNSIFADNSAPFGGGAIDTNTISVVTNANHNVYWNDTGISGVEDNCNGCTSNSNAVAATSEPLSALANYGGATQTMLPLPGSQAICAGLLASIPNGVTTDQRGNPRTTTVYGGTTCVDAGAVQTAYSLNFTTSPSSTQQAGVALAPAPAVQLLDNGAAINLSGASASLAIAAGTLSGTTTVSTNASGTTTFAAVSVSAEESNDTLIASLPFYVSSTNSISNTVITATSSSFNVNAITLAPSSSTLSAQVGAAYSQTITASGGVAPYTYTLTSGTLPAGVTLNASTGVLSGTPTAGGSFSITVQAQDSHSFTASKAYTLSVSAASIALTPTTSTLTSGTFAAAYSQTIAASGGTAPYTYSVSSGSLPTGLTLNSSTGVISGTPTAASSYNFSIQAKDSSTGTGPFTSSRSYSISIGPATPTVNWSTPTAITYGTALSAAQLNASSTVAGTNFAYNPAAGTVLNAGPHTLSVTFTPNDTTDYTTATQTVSLSVTQAPQTISFTQPTTPVLYSVSPITLTATGGTSGNAVVFSVVSGPATISGSTLTITGVGTVVVAANQAGNTNYTAATQVTKSIQVNQASATVTLGNLSQTYTGSTLPATATTNPTGLSVNLTYNGSSTAPTSVGSYTVVGTINNANYQGSSTGTLAIGKATLVITAGNASKVYGTANPAFTGSLTGQQGSDTFTESYSSVASATSPVGTYAIVPSVTGSSLSNYTQSITNGTLTITQASATTSLSVSSGSVVPGQNVTMTAQVAPSTSGTPTGTVSFYDNGTLLNAATLSGGTASYSTASLTAGTIHTITALYGGDTNFTSAVSSSSSSTTTVNVAALDFTMTITGSSSTTVIPGAATAYQLTMTPEYGNYASTVNFTVSGLPVGATATFSPSSIAANSGTQTVTLTIQTPNTLAAAHPSPVGHRLQPLALAFLLLLGAGGMRRRARNMRSILSMIVLLLAGASTLMLNGCGNDSGFFAQTRQSYTVTITASSGNLQHSSTVTLNVE